MKTSTEKLWRLAGCIDHTLLKAEALPRQIEALCCEAVEYQFAAVCVNPLYVALAARILDSQTMPRPAVCSVVGFPLGASTSANKSDEARRAIDEGASEIDMVIPLGLLIAGDGQSVRADIESVARVVHGSASTNILKVILETSALTEEQIITGCRCAMEGEADFVKTSTGFHPTGGATLEHVHLLRKFGSPMKVKASGGIRTSVQAMAMIEAGASRIGTSSGPSILAEWANAGSSIPAHGAR